VSFQEKAAIVILANVVVSYFVGRTLHWWFVERKDKKSKLS